MKAFIFDLDGTLLRLDVDIEEVRQRLGTLFAPHGVTGPFRPILSRIPEAAREAKGADPDALARAAFAILTDWELRAAPTARARSGGPAMMAELAARGDRLGVVTNNGRACVEPALRAAGYDPALLGILVSRDDVAAPKPDPAGILRAAATLHAEDPWYVGDHPNDVQAARSARARLPRLRVAALRGGLATDLQLAAAGADRLIDSLAEVPAL